MYDFGNEILGNTFKNDLIKNECWNKLKCATRADPQLKKY